MNGTRRGDANAAYKADCWRVTNQTHHRLKIRGHDGALLLLSPLERGRSVDLATLELLELEKHEQAGLVLLQAEPGRWMSWRPFLRKLPSRMATLLLVVFVCILGILLMAAPSSLSVPLLWLALAVLVLSFLSRGMSASLEQRKRNRPFLNRMRQMRDTFLLFVVGLGIPLVVIFASSDFLEQLLKLPQAFNSPQPDLSVVAGRTLQLIFISVLSLLPAMLFFAFDREHQSSLRDRFVVHILRFDPSVETRQDVIARYGTRMDEAFGPERHLRAVGILPARRSPLIVASLVLSLGWTLTLLNFTRPSELNGLTGVLSLVHPQPTTFAFGFLGAYFYTLLTVFRSYARRDLQPKTYSHIATRVLMVMVLAWVLEESWKMLPPATLLPSQATLHTLAFVTGIIPETGLVFITELLRTTFRKAKRLLPGATSQAVDPHEPLTNLEGIDLYDRARLEDEGVANVEGLAHHDVVELLLQTRIPAPRLLDWVDQAILHLHANVDRMQGPVGKMGQVSPPRPDGSDAKPQKTGTSSRLLESLRKFGIRKATDLENTLENTGDNRASLTSILKEDPDGAGTLQQLQLLVCVIEDEQWMENLRAWATHPPLMELEVDAFGNRVLREAREWERRALASAAPDSPATLHEAGPPSGESHAEPPNRQALPERARLAPGAWRRQSGQVASPGRETLSGIPAASRSARAWLALRRMRATLLNQRDVRAPRSQAPLPASFRQVPNG